MMMYHILDAVRRFEPDFYSHLCRSYNLDADRIIGLFADVEEMGSGQLVPILRHLRSHDAYHEIVYLAGRNTLLMMADEKLLRPPLLGNNSQKYLTLLKQILPEYLGHASYITMLRGSIHFLEIRDSVFAREADSTNPLCGFYCGLLSELATYCGVEKPYIVEARCCAVEEDATTCLIQISL